MIKIAGFILISLLLITLLKDTKKEFALILAVGSGIILFAAVAGDLYEIIESLKDISSKAGDVSVYLSLMLKILAVTLVAQFVVDLCRDAGENALASQAETASKILILIMIMPLFETVINIITGLLK